ncbi:MAG TPA: hypothetical protein VEH84_16660 [Alphaproteobacteria bacterium]|nr:hypothetical protein [Alphaproteobacteria bacterium]
MNGRTTIHLECWQPIRHGAAHRLIGELGSPGSGRWHLTPPVDRLDLALGMARAGELVVSLGRRHGGELSAGALAFLLARLPELGLPPRLAATLESWTLLREPPAEGLLPEAETVAVGRVHGHPGHPDGSWVRTGPVLRSGRGALDTLTAHFTLGRPLEGPLPADPLPAEPARAEAAG